MAIIMHKITSALIKQSKGYTILEMLIVIAIVGVIMPAIFSILFVILQQQQKINEIVQTKRQGDYILSIMKEKIQREATGITDGTGTNAQCNLAGSSFIPASQAQPMRFTRDTSQFWYAYSAERLTHVDTAPNPQLSVQLHSDKIRVTQFGMECAKATAESRPIVSLSFTLQYVSPIVDTQLGTTELTYQTKIRLP